jgi:hypothetical protein
VQRQNRSDRCTEDIGVEAVPRHVSSGAGRSDTCCRAATISVMSSSTVSHSLASAPAKAASPARRLILLFGSPLRRYQGHDGTASAHDHKGLAAANSVSQLGEPPLGLGNTDALDRHVLKSPRLQGDFKYHVGLVSRHRPSATTSKPKPATRFIYLSALRQRLPAPTCHQGHYGHQPQRQHTYELLATRWLHLVRWQWSSRPSAQRGGCRGPGSLIWPGRCSSATQQHWSDNPGRESRRHRRWGAP